MRVARRTSVLLAGALVASGIAMLPAQADDASDAITLAVEGTVRAVVVDRFGAETASDHLFTVVTDEGAEIPVDLPHETPANGRFDGELVVDGDIEAALKAKDLLPREGSTIAEDTRAGRVAVAEAQRQDAPLEVATSTVAPVTAAAVTAPGAHRAYVAVMTNRGSVEESSAQVKALVDQMTSYWTVESAGAITSFQVQGEVATFASSAADETDQSCGMSSPGAVWNEARNQFPGVLFSTTSRNHLVVAMADECGDGGIAGVASVGNDLSSGGPMSVSLGDIATQVGVHELGHTFGLGHANLDDCPSSDSCGGGEYFDLFSPMSLAVSGSSFSSPALDSGFRSRLGVADLDDVPLVTLANGSATRSLRLRPRSDTTGTRGAEVVDPASGTHYFVEHRSGTGRDATSFYAGTSSLYGVPVDYDPGVTITTLSSSGELTLVSRPVSARRSGSWLTGQTFTTPSSSLQVAVTSTTSSAADVTVSFPNAPTITTSTPTIAGSVAAGQKVTAVPGAWESGATFAYDWRIDGVATGATTATYVVPADAQGKALSVRVTGSTNGTKPATTTSSPVTIAAALPRVGSATPTTAGTAVVGGSVTAVAGAWEIGADLTYDWQLDGTSTSVTGAVFVPPATSAGRVLTVEVTGTKDGRAPATAESAGVVVAPAAATAGAVSWVGTPSVGSVVTAQIAGWAEGTSVKYQWMRDDVPIVGATSSAFAIPASMAGSALRVVATGTRAGYTTASRASESRTVQPGSLAAPTPRIAGTAKVGRTLKVQVGSWVPRPTFRYQWFANGRKISSKGTKASFRVTAKQKGKRITVRVTGIETGYATTSKTSRRTTKVSRS